MVPNQMMQANHGCQGREVTPANPNEEFQSNMYLVSYIRTQNSMESM